MECSPHWLFAEGKSLSGSLCRVFSCAPVTSGHNVLARGCRQVVCWCCVLVVCAWVCLLQVRSGLRLVLLSCVTFVVESLPALREHDHPEYKHVWFEVDGSFAVVFSLEFLLRLWCTNETYCLFLKDPLNIVDIFAVSPFWVQLALKDLVNLQFLRALRLFRVFRIFKLAHSSVHLRIMVLAITQSTDTLVLLMVFLAIAVFVFASRHMVCGERRVGPVFAVLCSSWRRRVFPVREHTWKLLLGGNHDDHSWLKMCLHARSWCFRINCEVEADISST